MEPSTNSHPWKGNLDGQMTVFSPNLAKKTQEDNSIIKTEVYAILRSALNDLMRITKSNTHQDDDPAHIYSINNGRYYSTLNIYLLYRTRSNSKKIL